MNLSILFDQFEEIRSISSRLEKEEILSDILQSENAEILVKICKFLFNPYRRLNVRVTTSMIDDAIWSSSSGQKNQTDDEIWLSFGLLLVLLEHGLSGNEARKEIKNFLSILPDDYVEWFSLIFNKDWKIGVGRPTIQKLLGKDFAPNFGCQLCKKWDGQDLPYDHMIQPKLDGIRGLCGQFSDSQKRVALTRNGKQLYNIDPILSELNQLEQYFDQKMIFDGEFYFDGWEKTMSVLRRSTRDHAEQDKMSFYVFDLVPLHQWDNEAFTQILRYRDKNLKKCIDTIKPTRVKHVPSVHAKTADHIKEIVGQYISEGWEGAIIKDPRSLYSFDRSAAWQKIKDSNEVDAEIVGVKLGLHDPNTNEIVENSDPRYQNFTGNPVVRSIIVDPGNGAQTSVGSGLEVSDKYNFYSLHTKGQLIGQIAEIRYQEYTPDGFLRFPRFVRTREDRTS